MNDTKLQQLNKLITYPEYQVFKDMIEQQREALKGSIDTYVNNYISHGKLEENDAMTLNNLRQQYLAISMMIDKPTKLIESRQFKDKLSKNIKDAI